MWKRIFSAIQFSDLAIFGGKLQVSFEGSDLFWAFINIKSRKLRTFFKNKWNATQATLNECYGNSWISLEPLNCVIETFQSSKSVFFCVFLCLQTWNWSKRTRRFVFSIPSKSVLLIHETNRERFIKNVDKIERLSS